VPHPVLRLPHRRLLFQAVAVSVVFFFFILVDVQSNFSNVRVYSVELNAALSLQVPWQCSDVVTSRGGHGSRVPESILAGFCVFLSDPDPDPRSKICEKPDPESLFKLGSGRSLCSHFLSKTLVNFGWIDGSRSLNRSRILKFEKFPDSDPVSKILEQERSRSL